MDATAVSLIWALKMFGLDVELQSMILASISCRKSEICRLLAVMVKPLHFVLDL